MRNALVLAVLLSSCSAVAPRNESHFGPVDGESLLAVGGSYSRINPDVGQTSNLVTVQTAFGYFLTKEHEVGGQILVGRADSGNTEAESTAVLPYYNYNYRQSSRTWYYVGPHLGVINTVAKSGAFKSDDTNVSIGVHGGIRQWLTPNSALYLEPRLTFNSDVSDFTLLFGVNFTL